MIFQFNTAQLSRSQQNSLMDVLGVMQAESTNELVVTPVEFPNKFKVKLDEDVEMIIVWDAEKKSYGGLTEPTPEPVAEIEEPEQQPEQQFEPVPEPESWTELKVKTLALDFIKIVKPLDVEHRCKAWIDFCTIVVKEILV